MQMVVILIAAAVPMMAATVIAPALPSIAHAFLSQDPTGVHSRLLLTAPALVTIFAAPLAGWIGDRWKRVPLLVLGLVLFSVFGTAGLWLDRLDFLLASRFSLGIAMGLLMSSSSALIGDYYVGEIRAKVMGYQGISNSIAGMLFISMGGALSGLGWRNPFTIYGVGVVIAVLAFLYLPEPPRHNNHSAESATPRVRTHWSRLFLVYFTGFLGIICFFLIPVNVAFILLERFEKTGLVVGLVMSSTTLMSAVSAGFFPRLVKHLGRERLFALTFSFMASAMWIIAWAPTLPLLILGLLLNGCGLGLMFPNAGSAVLALSSQEHRGRVMGLMSSCFFLGQFLSPILTGIVKGAIGSLESVFRLAGYLAAALAIVYWLWSSIKKAHS